jgi:hypothetical protein
MNTPEEEYQERMGSPEMEYLQHQTDFPEQHTPDTEWESNYDAMVEDARIYSDFPDILAEHIKGYVRKEISSRDTYWKERVDRAFVILDTNIQELVTYEERRVSKESVLTCVRRIKRELDNLK